MYKSIAVLLFACVAAVCGHALPQYELPAAYPGQYQVPSASTASGQTAAPSGLPYNSYVSPYSQYQVPVVATQFVPQYIPYFVAPAPAQSAVPAYQQQSAVPAYQPQPAQYSGPTYF